MTDPTTRELIADLLAALKSWSPTGEGPLEGAEEQYEAALIAKTEAFLAQPEPVRVKGNATVVYEDADDSRTRIAKCIAFELHNGGSVLAAAKAILRDVELGYITPPQPEPEVPTDEELLFAFYEASLAEGGDTDEVTLRGLRAVLARWGK